MIYLLGLILKSFIVIIPSDTDTLNLPLDIKLGVTEYHEIINYSTCITFEGNNCIKASVMDNSFIINGSSNGTVGSVTFSASENHKLPISWNNLGVQFSKGQKKCLPGGSTHKDIREILGYSNDLKEFSRSIDEVIYITNKYRYTFKFSPGCGLREVKVGLIY
jgi:hypothetical protein